VAAFLLEIYVPSDDDVTGERLHAAARDLAGKDPSVRTLRSILVPEDETWLLLVEAKGEEAVREATRRAGLRVDRLTAAIALSEGAD
jgi:hypothetical protein